ncbi:TPA: Mu-like prophage major head subunit gpT family protein [Haemophilus influenzae]|uniref:Mu-like prophage major head subunit gpT family protein n=1 Tax=Haemophilus influenzae TaxID=727 RepID=UPI000E0D9006|nr:Mu-like prophage major head subunit gpT family protein [Haemophilus influenzae]AXH82180.1 head protein [Haemophilus influenzae]NKB30209.1 head protein [Haemophilus influenzae]
MFKKSEVLKAIETQFKKDFAAGLGLIKPQWDLIAMKVSSNTKVNTYGFLGQFPKMVEWVNKRQRKAMQAQGTSIENKLYESTVGIARTDIEDDQVGLFRPMVQQAAQSTAELPDDLVFGLLKAGKTTLCYDGQNYFDTDHPVFDNVDGTGSSKEQSNITTGTKTEAPTFYIFDTTNAIKPLIWQERTAPEIETKFDPSKSDTVFNEDIYEWGVRARGAAGFGFWQLAHCVEKTELTAENIMDVIAKMQSLKGDGGKLLNIRPNVILVPPALEFKARQICEGELINGTTNILKGRLKVIVSPQIIAE